MQVLSCVLYSEVLNKTAFNFCSSIRQSTFRFLKNFRVEDFFSFLSFPFLFFSFLFFPFLFFPFLFFSFLFFFFSFLFFSFLDHTDCMLNSRDMMCWVFFYHLLLEILLHFTHILNVLFPLEEYNFQSSKERELQNEYVAE